MDTSPWQDQDH